MDSDSDATIIEDEAMDVEEIPLRNSQMGANPSTAPQTSEHSGADVNNESASVPEPVTDNDSERQQLEPAQPNEGNTIEPEGVVEVANREDTNSESQSLLDARNHSESCSKLTESAAAEVRREEDGQSPKKRPRSEDDDDDGKTCPICLDNWTNLGEHRICALKCGHLFGFHCITRWFSTQKKKSCPTCKKKAARCDIRYIYAKKLIAMDVAELEEVKKQLEDVTQEKNRIQIELTKAICREHLNIQQVEDLKKKVQYLDSALEVRRQFNHSQTNNDPGNAETVRLYMDKSLEICKDAGCRVLDSFNSHDLIVVSMKSPNALFQGFGVRKINISTYRPTAFIPLHSKSIRDVRFHSENPWLLSVALDKTIKIVDAMSNMSIAVTTCNVPLWSCCWDVNNSNMLYVGKQQGSVAKFDIRQLSEPVCTLEVPGDMSPVVSVASIAASPGEAVSRGGIISCKLNSIWVFENTPSEYTRYPLPLEGPFTSMTYQNSTRQLLVSTRPNTRHPHSRHHLISIENGAANNLLCNTIHCIAGSSTQKFLSRSCLLSNKSDYYVAAHQETNRSVFLWNVSTGHKSCSLPAHDPVLDLCGVGTNNGNFVAALTEKKLEFFKFV